MQETEPDYFAWSKPHETRNWKDLCGRSERWAFNSCAGLKIVTAHFFCSSLQDLIAGRDHRWQGPVAAVFFYGAVAALQSRFETEVQHQLKTSSCEAFNYKARAPELIKNFLKNLKPF